MAGMVCLGCVLVGAVLGYVWLQVQRVRVSYELEGLRSARARLEEQTGSSSSSWPPSGRSRGWTRPRGGWARPPAPDQIRLAREYLAPDGSGAHVSAGRGRRLEQTGRP